LAGGSACSTSPVRGKIVVTSDKAALPIGPYSQGIQAGDFVFVAGEKGIDPKTGKMVPGGIGAETRQTIENIKAIVEEAGASLDDAVASVVYLTDINEFEEMNEVYAEYFKENPPGRTTVGVSALPAGARVEITVTVMKTP
jgi:2-iminobutanoate/2-iminopropanoate deaminase